MVEGAPNRASALVAGGLPFLFIALITDILLLATSSESSARCTESGLTAAKAPLLANSAEAASATVLMNFIFVSRGIPCAIVQVRSSTASKRVDPRHFPPDDQLMHRFGAFVGDHRFQVQRVPDRAVLGGDARAAEDIARLAGDVQRHPHVVPLRQRHL